MSSNVNVNLPGTIDTASTFTGTLDTSSTISGNLSSSLAVTEIATINTNSALGITQLPEIKLGITELPQINIQFGLRPARIHFPTTMKFAICAFGMELLSLSTCGESMVVIEDFHPHAREQCR